MPVYSFPCPHCSARLRLRDRRLIGRTVDCPDCRRDVLIEDDAELGVRGRIAGRRGESDGRGGVDERLARAADPFLLRREWLTRAASPLVISWTVAAVLSVAVVGWLVTMPSDSARSSSRTQSAAAPEAALPDAPAEGTFERPNDVDEQIAGRYEALFGRVGAHRERTGSWPRGTTGDDRLPKEARFSWLAVLAAQSQPAGPQPHWDRSWNDPLNERFVRQRQEAYLNPAIARQTGDDRYPATHFVGVTGCGADADSLPSGHPRAGVFGSDRVTSVLEITDGLANTLLMAGVERRLGSWAAGGPSTLRAFTTEPYVNGPDGFGTGQPDGMFVLMADGSVRRLSSETDPHVIRQLAAKADGQPVAVANRPPTGGVPPQSDEQIADRHPTDTDEEQRDTLINEPPPDVIAVPAAVENAVAELAAGADQPLEVPLAEGADDEEPPQVIDIAAALGQPIASFEQSTPVAAERLLETLEEMAAVRIDSSPVAAAAPERLQQPVTVVLHETTVGGILTALLDQLDLSYETEADGIRLRPQPRDGE